MKTIALKKEGIKKKRGEIQRLLYLMEYLDLDYKKLSEITEVSMRTIQNCVWNDDEIGGHLLRALHLKLGVSIDWILSGSGSMLYGDRGIQEPSTSYESDSRAGRMISFIKDFMRESDSDEMTWLEMQFKFHVPQYQQFLKENINER